MADTKINRCLRATRLLLGALALSCAYANEAPSEIAIHFQRGAYAAQVGGEMRSVQDEIRYLVAARGGQHMTITLDAPGAMRGEVIFPDGTSQGSPGEVLFDDVLPASGNYHIHLRESPMGEEWRGKFKLTVEIR